MKIRYTQRAADNLIALKGHIALDKPIAAAQVSQRLQASIEALGRFPSMGRIGEIPGTRELVVAPLPYIVIYRIRRQVVEILAIAHTSQSWIDGLS